MQAMISAAFEATKERKFIPISVAVNRNDARNPKELKVGICIFNYCLFSSQWFLLLFFCDLCCPQKFWDNLITMTEKAKPVVQTKNIGNNVPFRPTLELPTRVGLSETALASKKQVSAAQAVLIEPNVEVVETSPLESPVKRMRPPDTSGMRPPASLFFLFFSLSYFSLSQIMGSMIFRVFNGVRMKTRIYKQGRARTRANRGG